MKLKCLLFVLPFLFGCNRNDEINVHQSNEKSLIIENHKYTDDEKLIFDIILEDATRWISYEDDDILFFVDRNYILSNDFHNKNITDYLRNQNLEDELIESFIKNNRNRETIEILLPSKFQFKDDFTDKELIETTLNDSRRLKYILIKISNICFNKEMNKAIVYFSEDFRTFSFVSASSYYIIFEKNNTKWEQTVHTTIWSGTS
jgi:hypothetical protein